MGGRVPTPCYFIFFPGKHARSQPFWEHHVGSMGARDAFGAVCCSEQGFAQSLPKRGVLAPRARPAPLPAAGLARSCWKTWWPQHYRIQQSSKIIIKKKRKIILKIIMKMLRKAPISPGGGGEENRDGGNRRLNPNWQRQAFSKHPFQKKMTESFGENNGFPHNSRKGRVSPQNTPQRHEPGSASSCSHPELGKLWGS